MLINGVSAGRDVILFVKQVRVCSFLYQDFISRMASLTVYVFIFAGFFRYFA